MLFQFPYGRTAFAGNAVAPAAKKHKVFISFCHKDQRYKDALAAWGKGATSSLTSPSISAIYPTIGATNKFAFRSEMIICRILR